MQGGADLTYLMGVLNGYEDEADEEEEEEDVVDDAKLELLVEAATC